MTMSSNLFKFDTHRKLTLEEQERALKLFAAELAEGIEQAPHTIVWDDWPKKWSIEEKPEGAFFVAYTQDGAAKICGFIKNNSLSLMTELMTE